VGLLPAIAAVQVAKDRALQALDPRDWFYLLRWMKTDYLLVLAGILIYWLAAYILVVTPLGEYVPLFIEVALLMFGWIAVQALLGGAIRERRISDPDDSPVERFEEAESQEQIERHRERKIDRIYGEWRSGAQKNAWQTLMREVQDSGDALVELRWMLERIAKWDEPRLMNRNRAGTRTATDRRFPLRRSDQRLRACDWPPIRNTGPSARRRRCGSLASPAMAAIAPPPVHCCVTFSAFFRMIRCRPPPTSWRGSCNARQAERGKKRGSHGPVRNRHRAACSWARSSRCGQIASGYRIRRCSPSGAPPLR